MRIKKEQIPAACRKWIEECESKQMAARTEALRDVRFYCGDQWDALALKAREGLPCLVFNYLPSIVSQVEGDQRQNDMAIKVSPVDSGADKEMASVREDLIRQIEYASKMDEARSTAFKFMLVSGFPGFLRVMTRYCHDDAFEQELTVRAIRNPFSVYWDWDAQEPDFSDARACAIVDSMPKDEAEMEFPGLNLTSIETGTGDTDPSDGGDKDYVRIAEYFWAEHETRELVMTVDGRAVYREDMDETDALLVDPGVPPRKVKARVIYRVKCDGSQVLEEPTKLKIKHIPIVPVMPMEMMVENDRYFFGLVRWSRDPQAEYNYMRSKNVEVVALAPKARWLVTEKMIEGVKHLWEKANHLAMSYLPYKPDQTAPNLGPREIPPPNPGASIMQDSVQSLADMKAVIGVPDARMGLKSNEHSGVAIQARRRQSETATFSYIDNLARANRQVGRILVDWIPHVYDSERVVRVRGVNGDYRDVTVNQVVGPDMVLHDLTTGKYDVTVDVGPSFASQREELLNFILEYLRVDPESAPVIRDILWKSVDVPNADEIAERFKMMLPPGMNGQPVQPQAPDPVAANAGVKAEADARKAMADAEMAELNSHKAHADVAAYAMDRAVGAPPDPRTRRAIAGQIRPGGRTNERRNDHHQRRAVREPGRRHPEHHRR